MCNKNNLESLNILNKSLIHVSQESTSPSATSTKEISKWIIQSISNAAFKQNVDTSKIAKFFQSTYGLDEAKAGIIKQLVNFKN